MGCIPPWLIEMTSLPLDLQCSGSFTIENSEKAKKIKDELYKLFFESRFTSKVDLESPAPEMFCKPHCRKLTLKLHRTYRTVANHGGFNWISLRERYQEWKSNALYTFNINKKSDKYNLTPVCIK